MIDEKSTLCFIDGPQPFEETKHQKSQGRVVLRGDIVILDLLQSSVFQTIYIPSKKKGENLTLKKMFEISEQLVLEQLDEIFGVSQISW